MIRYPCFLRTAVYAILLTTSVTAASVSKKSFHRGRTIVGASIETTAEQQQEQEQVQRQRRFLQQDPEGCELCAQTGQCNHAFRNNPGQYCGRFIGGKSQVGGGVHLLPCCCPYASKCKLQATACQCHVNDDYQPPRPTRRHEPGDMNTTVAWLIVAAIVLGCCLYGRVCLQGNKSNNSNNNNNSEGKTTVPNGGGYYSYVPAPSSSSAPPPAYNPEVVMSDEIPTAQAMPIGSQGPRYGSMGGGGSGGGLGGVGAAALGATGGFLAGTLFGEHRSSQQQQQQHYGGGYDIRGDSGGGGYDIVGDSGGGGYDIAGDSGGGGYDIGGDS